MHVVIDVCEEQCHASVHVVIGVRIVLCCPLEHNSTFLAFYFVPNSHCCHAVIVHPTFTCCLFSHVFAPYSHDILGVVFKQKKETWVKCSKRSENVETLANTNFFNVNHN